MRQIFFLSLIMLASVGPLKAGQFPINIPGLNAIYGNDDREIVTKKTAKDLRVLSQSVAMIVQNDFLAVEGAKAFISGETLEKSLNICADERFSQQPSLSSCTGFLVGDNILATAGHCFQVIEDCENKKIIFDLTGETANKTGYEVPSKNVYSCKKIIAQSFEGMKDFALIELDRKVKNRRPLAMNLKNKIANDAKVFMIGHPLGQPLMISHSAKVNDNSDSFQFKALLDSFEGNSGSPVFNSKTHKVEGILVNGQQDFVQDEAKGCYRYKQYEATLSSGEGVTRAIELLPFL